MSPTCLCLPLRKFYSPVGITTLEDKLMSNKQSHDNLPSYIRHSDCDDDDGGDALFILTILGIVGVVALINLAHWLLFPN